MSHAIEYSRPMMTEAIDYGWQNYQRTWRQDLLRSASKRFECSALENLADKQINLVVDVQHATDEDRLQTLRRKQRQCYGSTRLLEAAFIDGNYFQRLGDAGLERRFRRIVPAARAAIMIASGSEILRVAHLPNGTKDKLQNDISNNIYSKPLYFDGTSLQWSPQVSDWIDEHALPSRQCPATHWRNEDNAAVLNEFWDRYVTVAYVQSPQG